MTEFIHIVDADEAVRQLLQVNLQMAGYQVAQAGDAHTAWLRLWQQPPDLLVLGHCLPADDALQLLRRVRGSARSRDLPVLLLSGRQAEADVLAAFDAGADDVLPTPFHPRLLIARVQALLRRVARNARLDPLDVDGLRVDPQAGQAWAAGRSLRLRENELRLLYALLRQPSRVLSREDLLTRAWPQGHDVSDRVVDACVARLRAELEQVGHYPCIQTVRAVGYRLVRRAEVLVHG